MLTPSIEKKLNRQIALEADAQALYLSIATWADVKGLPESASFFYEQSKEEEGHMMKIIHYMTDCGIRPELPATRTTVNRNYTSQREIYEKAYQSECKVSRAIHEVVEEALKQKDYRTFGFMQWYVKEQLEEEVKMKRVLDMFNLMEPGGVTKYTLERAVRRLHRQE